MSSVEGALVWCPFPNADEARKAAKVLLAEKLIACANIVPLIESVFEWQGEIECEEESAALFKTTSEKMDGVVSRLEEIHPYEVPAILAWRCDYGSPKTLHWLENTVQAIS